RPGSGPCPGKVVRSALVAKGCRGHSEWPGTSMGGDMKRNGAALIVVVIAIAPLATACPAPRSPSKYGVNNSDAPAHMELMRDAGFKWARYFVSWDDLE